MPHDQRQKLRHIEEICQQYGYREINTPFAGFRLTRWLYAQCWTGSDRPIVLFEQATSWLLAHKILLPTSINHSVFDSEGTSIHKLYAHSRLGIKKLELKPPTESQAPGHLTEYSDFAK